MQTDNNIVSSCKYHVVFCTKYKRKVLTEDIAKMFVEILDRVSKELGFEILDVEVHDFYIHMMVEVSPKIGVHKVVTNVKSATHRDLCEAFPELKSKLPSLWTRSYFASTFGSYSVTDIDAYICEQEVYTRSKKSCE